MTRALRVLVPLVVVVLMLAGAELALRALDGHRFDSLLLQPRRQVGEYAGKWQQAEDVVHLLSEIPLSPGVDPKWFTLQIPERPRHTVDPEIAERSAAYPGLSLQATYEWNRAYVQRTLCHDDRRRQAVFDRLADVYVFDALEPFEYPTFRFHRDVTYPSGLTTNRFGWRGSDVSMEKPPQTIRIGFVGASTTIAAHGDPYSYPELVEAWLNVWAASRHRNLRFEALNTAREGTNTRSMRYIVRQELLPLEPDMVVFYEGSNHFWPADFIWDSLPPRPLGQVADQPGLLARHSALAARLRNLFLRGAVVGEEGEKPALIVHWPDDLSETEPDLTDRRLPTDLANVVEDFDVMRTALDGIGARFVPTSFTWLVYDGLKLDPRRDDGLYRYLNEAFWPFTYAHMRRILDFQNRVYRRYAEQHGLDFFDYDAQFPKDPRLFYDAIHLTRAGTRLQAWIMLQGIVRVVEREIAAGAWPRPDQQPLQQHPAFAAPRQIESVQTLSATCQARTE
jgi:hypothetical protein